MSEHDTLLTAGIDVGTSAIKVAILRDEGPGNEKLLCAHSERIQRGTSETDDVNGIEKRSRLNPARMAIDAATICTLSFLKTVRPNRSSQAPADIRMNAPPANAQTCGITLASTPRICIATSPAPHPAATASPPRSGIPCRRLILRSLGRSTAPIRFAKRITRGVVSAATPAAIDTITMARISST